MSLTVTAFCQRNSEESPKPGASLRNVQLNSVRKEQDETDPNAALFSDVSGSIYLQLSGVSEDVASQFKGGQKYKITVEAIKG